MTVKVIDEPNYTITLTMDEFNKRVRVDDYYGHFNSCIQAALKAVEEISAEKLIFKTRKKNVLTLMEHGFLYEAVIEDFYFGDECYFLSKYFTVERKNSMNWMKEDEILRDVLHSEKKKTLKTAPSEYEIRKATLADAEDLATLYKKVFQVYPTPMNDPSYIEKVMKADSVFYIYTYNGAVVSAASAEIDITYRNAEITDCATLPEHRQFGLMQHLMTKLQEDMKREKIFCLYSIARALSYGMNAALHQHDFKYRGRLANNCYIFDKLEDMNMWVKSLG